MPATNEVQRRPHSHANNAYISFAHVGQISFSKLTNAICTHVVAHFPWKDSFIAFFVTWGTYDNQGIEI